MFSVREKKPMLNPAIVSEQMQVFIVKYRLTPVPEWWWWGWGGGGGGYVLERSRFFFFFFFFFFFLING